MTHYQLKQPCFLRDYLRAANIIGTHGAGSVVIMVFKMLGGLLPSPCSQDSEERMACFRALGGLVAEGWNMNTMIGARVSTHFMDPQRELGKYLRKR